MRGLALTAGGVLLLASTALAQPMPSGHSRHHPAKQSAAMTGGHCASEAQMQQMTGMMQQMMQMHQQMMSGQGMKMPMNGGMNMPMQPASPGQNPPQADPHQH